MRMERIWAMPNKWTFAIKPIASGLWIVIGIQVLARLKHWNKKFSDLYDELKWEVELWERTIACVVIFAIRTMGIVPRSAGSARRFRLPTARYCVSI